MTTQTVQKADNTPAIILLGRDDSGKPHASWFNEAEAEGAGRAADEMGLKRLYIATDALRGLAGGLARGKLFASGKAFVPFVKGDRFEVLAQHLPAEQQAEMAKKEFAPKDTLENADLDEGGDEAEAHFPRDWSEIKFGSLVLAYDADAEGWYEAQVIVVNAEGLFTLRWYWYPDLPPFNRAARHLALLHPDYETE